MASEQREAFQVDLHGVVDLFAHHLYSSPRVYLRELLQNGVDAITARQALEPDCPAQVRLVPTDGGGLEVHDTGIGLTAAEATELLATIGRSSKRSADLEQARGQYLGQFGIGLLSAFMVAERIEMYCRSARDLNAPPVCWTGYASGEYTLEEITLERYTQAAGTEEPGSTVVLQPRRDQEHWLKPDTVAALAEDFGSLLPLDIAIQAKLPDGERLWRRLSLPQPPWLAEHPNPAARERALAAYCEQSLGFTPLASFDLNLPLVGLTGVAFVLPTATSPTNQSAHRAYLKRMLVGQKVQGLLPDWAFFVRCVVDSSALRPTASREALYEDEILLATREALGREVLRWTAELLETPSAAQRAFVKTHHLAIRALALHDPDMLELAAKVLPYETSLGVATLAEAQAAQGQVLYTTTVEDYRRVAPVARAQGLGLVNAGYVYDADLLSRLAKAKPEWRIRPLEAKDVEQTLTPLEPQEELDFLDLLLAAPTALDGLDCEAVVRRFEPSELPAMFVTDTEIEHQRALDQTRQAADNIWADVLGEFAQATASRRLVLNASNQTVRALAAVADGEVYQAGTRSLYVTAQLLAGEPLRAQEADLMNDALGTLLRRAVRRDPKD
ncbi:MAG: HSP90 family protein [Bifidobacteriaceae bacterium]|jgi:molecular chaperone HtpG|nr:HSP90 family protein [Bifidobacteriaceae bacterium]